MSPSASDANPSLNMETLSTYQRTGALNAAIELKRFQRSGFSDNKLLDVPSTPSRVIISG